MTELVVFTSLCSFCTVLDVLHASYLLLDQHEFPSGRAAPQQQQVLSSDLLSPNPVRSMYLSSSVVLCAVTVVIKQINFTLNL